MDITVTLCLLVAGTLFSWLFRRLGLSDVVGYVLGGVAVSAALAYIGIDIGAGLSYGEPLRWLGLTLFSFTLGVSIGFHRIVENIRSVAASELVLYVVLWISSGFLAWVSGAGYVERVALFILLVNSSSAAIVALSRLHSISVPLRDRAAIQTSMEDLMQFILFTLLFVTGTSLTQSFFEAAVQVVTVIGLAVLLLAIARYLLRFLSGTEFIADRENRFVVTIGVAILFASIASILGMPPLFGAFIAGISFSMFLSLDGISDMVNGLRNLGLLLYFTSLGSQLYLKIMGAQQGLDLVLSGVALGLAAFVFRALGLFIATLFTGYRVSESAALALSLTPLSEMGIIFIDTLVERSIVSDSIAVLFTVAVFTTMILFSILTPRAVEKTGYLECVVPSRTADFFRNLADLYMRRIDVATTILTPIIKFTIVALSSSYINSLAIDVVERFKLPPVMAMALALATSIAILLAFLITLRSMFNYFLKQLTAPIGRLSEALGKVLDLFIGGLALALQIHILLEISSKIFAREPLYTIPLVVGLTIILLATLELIRHYLKIGVKSSSGFKSCGGTSPRQNMWLGIPIMAKAERWTAPRMYIALDLPLHPIAIVSPLLEGFGYGGV